jgi:hypothetical protein
LVILAGEVEHVYYFGNPSVKTSGEYQSLNFENTMLSALAGQPAIPYQQLKLMLPPGESARSLEIVFSDETVLPGKYNLSPQQGVRPLSEGNSGEFVRDGALYKSKAAYPASPQGHLITAYLNGRAFALSTFSPVRYIPATGKVSYYRTARVIVHTMPDLESQSALSNFSAATDRAARFADNGEMDKQYTANRQPATDSYEILIICTSAYSTAFEGYRAACLKQGLRSQVVALETITSTMSGIDVPEKIRNYIKQEYQAHDIQHVLLGGDTELVPYRGFYGYVKSGSGYTSNNIPADIYYSSLDGNWNYDGDSRWGEPADTLAPFNPEEADLLPEISVGRLPFSTIAELNAMLHKSYSYQFTPVDGEFRNVLMAGEYLYAAPYYTQGSFYMELLIGLQTAHGYTTTGIPATYPFDKLYDETASWSKTDLINHLNQGRPMLNHAGHANQTYVMRLSNSDITNANFTGLNGTTHNYTIVYTHGCDCGAFDNNSTDCIGEKMVTIDNFAAAFVGNSRYGWFNEGTSEGPSAHLHREYMDALYSDSLNRIGRAHMESKIATAPWVTAPGQWEPGAMRWCFYDCTVLGDPAMAVFTDNPIVIETVYPSSIPAGTTSIPVSVASAGTAVAGLTCVVLENGVMLGKASTNASGNAIVSLSPAIGNPENVQLVVSGYNCVPHTYNLTAKTYTWNTASGNWKTPASWSPVRTDPAANDILIFDGSLQANASVTLDFTSAENTGCLRILNNANVTLATATASRKIQVGVSGSVAPQFEIAQGSSLNILAAMPVMLSLAEGNTAAVSGNIVFQHAAHRLTSGTAEGITFTNGASFTAESDFPGNAFGIGMANTVKFANGSRYVQKGGSSPFGLPAPQSVVVFEPGSLYTFTASTGVPDLSGRTLGNLEINSTSANLSSITGAGSLTVHDLTVAAGNCGINLSGGINMSGNLSVLTAGSLNFTPSAVAPANLNGLVEQSISGGGAIVFNSNSSLNIANPAGVNLATDIAVNGPLMLTSGLLTIGNNNLTLGSSSVIVGSPSVTNMVVASGSGEMRKCFSNTGTFTFPIGDTTGTPEFSPVTLSFTGGTFQAGAYVGVNVANGPVSGIASSYLNRKWTVASSGIESFSCDASFDYAAADVNGNEASLYCVQVLPPDILFHNPANTTLHQLSATGISSFGVFTGESNDISKTLTLTAVFPEGLYNGAGSLLQAQNGSGANWPTGVADHIAVELHDAANYGTVIFTASDVELSTSGSASVTVPLGFNGTYFITVRHRNSIAAVSAQAISFAGSTVSRAFGGPADIFGGNLKQMGDMGYALFGGDVNQDGSVDMADLALVEYLAATFTKGYLSEDCNGDGVIDSCDLIITDNNASGFVGAKTP